jgi:hypothetical protein
MDLRRRDRQADRAKEIPQRAQVETFATKGNVLAEGRNVLRRYTRRKTPASEGRRYKGKRRQGCRRYERRNLRLVDEAMVDCVEGQFEAVGDAEFVEDVVEMILDGLLGDEKLFADFLVAETLGDELDDLFFAVAEQRLFAARAGFAGFRKCFHDFGGHAVVEPDFSGVHAMNALDEKIGSGLLQNHAASAEAHGTDDVAIIFGRGEDDNARGQRIEIDFLEDGEAVFIGHAEIEEKNVGLQFGKELDALRAILSFADNGDFLVGIEQFAEAIAKDRMVIG